jgi:hypothetical protein
LEKHLQTTYSAELISQILFIFQRLGVVDTTNIMKLFEFADTDILNIRPIGETLDDITAWTLEARSKFEKQMA